MKILFLHGWNSAVGGVKPTYLKDHGHEVINPALPHEDMAEAVRIAQAEFDKHQPQVVIGSSRGGAVAMNIYSGDAMLVLLCPAWKKYGTAKTVKPDTVILHSRADDQGVMRSRVRKAQVSLFEPLPGEVPALYEMGLPVVETGDKWHVNVHQKVPLNRDRDNVKPAYLQAVRVAVLNTAHDLLTSDDEVTAGWVKLAGADARCSGDAIKHLIRLRFGEMVAAPDPSDTEAMKRFQSQGGVIVAGLSKGEWANVKRAGAVLPAGKICPTPKPYSDDPDAPLVDIVPPDQWTEGIKSIAEYARFLGRELMGIEVVVSVVRTTNNFAAAYGSGRLDLNLVRLGHKWFQQGATEDVDRLLIHEFGHEYSGDHLSEDYHEALCRLGASLKRLALEKPDELRRFIRE